MRELKKIQTKLHLEEFTLLYLIVLFIMAFIFLYNYEINSKYIITYNDYQKKSLSPEEFDESEDSSP